AGTVSVDYATNGGTAIPITDYTPVSGTLVFADGETAKTFNVSLADDQTPEPAEMVNLVLSNPNGGATLGNPSVAVLNINDNDNGALLSLAGSVVTSADHTPIPNVLMTLQGSQTATTTTDASGRYSFTNLAPNGNYSVTPSALGFTFNPPSQQFINYTTSDLGVNFTADAAPSRQLKIIGGNAAPGQNVSATVELVAQGDENSVGFSLNFDQNVLSNPQVSLGADALSATLFANNSQSGKVGVLLGMPAGQAFAVGTKSIVTITFNTAPNLLYSSPITFGDVPIAREVSSVNADVLTANYLNGAVTFAQGFEADVAPRPTGSGNGSVTVADFTQVGRFVSGLDTVNPNFNEFQRADCAPRISLGNGSITVSDFTQAGRYASGLDVVNPAGGNAVPGFASVFIDAKDKSDLLLVPTVVRVQNVTASAGSQVVVSILTDAQGTENGFGFTLNYDSAKLANPLVLRGTDTQSATLIPNTTQTGKAAVVLAMPFGQAIAAGTRQLVTVRFDIKPNAPSGLTQLVFGDSPAFREVSDIDANVLDSSFVDGAINILSPTAASVSVGGKVFDANGNALANAKVFAVRSNGEMRTISTNSYGYFRFDAMNAGETYTFGVKHKNLQFAQKTLSIFEVVEDLNFTANPD
ncbi:MAG TPA: carboxypeptidase regulatory-like domain-containing protein, partial [Pyrinomonadaceae bacterium]|nr:carboxypeptidase regulatory-like domain-containing protein [Pyrinomonadaceae bacterium]